MRRKNDDNSATQRSIRHDIGEFPRGREDEKEREKNPRLAAAAARTMTTTTTTSSSADSESTAAAWPPRRKKEGQSDIFGTFHAPYNIGQC